MDNNRNLILAVVLCIALFFGWEFAMDRLYPQPKHPAAPTASQSAEVPGERAQGTGPAPKIRRTREGGLQDAQDIALEQKDLTLDLAAPGRVKIDAPEVLGSINPLGARIDDVELKSHRQTVDKASGPVRLFSPAGTPAQQFAQFGWVGEGIKLPDASTVTVLEVDSVGVVGCGGSCKWENTAGGFVLLLLGAMEVAVAVGDVATALAAAAIAVAVVDVVDGVVDDNTAELSVPTVPFTRGG